MAKKSKRSRRRSTAPRQQAQSAQRAAMPSRQAPPEEDAPRVTERASGGVDFAAEYRYVLSDLRRFGILAVAMFATLVVLALVLG